MSLLKSLRRSDDLLSDSYVDDVREKTACIIQNRMVGGPRTHLVHCSRNKAEGEPSYPKPRSRAADAASLVASCPFHFKRGHRVEQCRMFKELQPPERFKLMQEKGFCFACFGKHLRKYSKVNIRCPLSGCNGRHHPLLHEINVRGNRHREAAPSNEI